MTRKRKILIFILFVIIIALIALALNWFLILQKAHGTFEDYYSFRGCTELIEKTDTYGTCKLSSGKIIKIVKYQNKWFLDGDLPFGAVLPQPASSTPMSTATIEYKNTDYLFGFKLPSSWKGYTIINSSWQGNIIDSSTTGKLTGPEIIIRHPLWTSENPRQDIPIMIFTPTQWTLVEQEKLSLGAAPIGPSELGRNSNYIFAIPARYNFAFPTGFEEVIKILENNPLHN